MPFDICILKYLCVCVMCVLCVTPADFARLKATLDADRMRGAVAAGVRVVVTHVALLTFLHNQVSTDGLVTDWKTEPPHTIDHTTTKYTHTNVNRSLSALTLEALVLLQLEDVADVLDAARRELVVVFSRAVCGLREHQVAAFAAGRAEVAAVCSLVVLRRRPREVSHSVK